LRTANQHMRPQQELPEGTIKRMEELLKRSSKIEEHRRIQTILLRARLSLGAEEIAKMVGLSRSAVWKIQAEFFRQGETALKLKPKGGRYRENLSLNEEAALLGPFLKKAQDGGILEVGPIRKAYEQALGKKPALSTIYRVLSRHGWRKVTPRPSHPKSNKEAIEMFKKKLSKTR
jgi:transposase